MHETRQKFGYIISIIGFIFVEHYKMQASRKLQDSKSPQEWIPFQYFHGLHSQNEHHNLIVSYLI